MTDRLLKFKSGTGLKNALIFKIDGYYSKTL